MIRVLLAAGIAMAVSLIGTRLLILWLTRLRLGQPIRDDGPEGHMTKAGTPTMGGLSGHLDGSRVGYSWSSVVAVSVILESAR